ncbi:MAG: CPBP family intramembrane metalloprotease [Calditrichaeota bacterium]|nr:CPBP family intramembrane metalloprotease [Calditrichota bacterium]RQV98389.1 MAG: CPBP family intramembrane metalloprotease [Calditrichota bacterium]
MNEKKLKPLGSAGSVFYFGIPALLLYTATHLGIPLLHQWTGLPAIVCWYIGGGFLVFLPMFIASFIFIKKEGINLNFREPAKRFRLDRFSSGILLLSISGIIATAGLTYLMLIIGRHFYTDFSAQPSFMQLKPLQVGKMWILATWIPMFIFNILGEGLYWRGTIFPRQELVLEDNTWLVHGFFWLLFHLPFGWYLMLTLIPIIFITAFLVQVTRSTWPDIIIHTVINGSGFLLVAFGIVT